MDYVVVMAGGTGKRLWPLSRKKRPKQVLKLIDGQTLLRRCFERLTPVFDTRNIIILTNANYVDTVRENLPELPPNNVIAEPAVRDTASAIGLAASILTKLNPQANMAVVTADQLIEPQRLLAQCDEPQPDPQQKREEQKRRGPLFCIRRVHPHFPLRSGQLIAARAL